MKKVGNICRGFFDVVTKSSSRGHYAYSLSSWPICKVQFGCQHGSYTVLLKRQLREKKQKCIFFNIFYILEFLVLRNAQLQNNKGYLWKQSTKQSEFVKSLFFWNPLKFGRQNFQIFLEWKVAPWWMSSRIFDWSHLSLTNVQMQCKTDCVSFVYGDKELTMCKFVNFV